MNRKVSLYDKTLETTRHKRTNYNNIEDKHERLRLQQRDYYNRKGFFNEYKKKICKKINIPYDSLKEIDCVEKLENYAMEYLETNHNIKLENGKAVAYILRIL